MRKITADIIYSNSSPPLEKGVVVIEDDGTVIDLPDTTDGLVDVEYHRGVLCPGFVNTHCHLELSHLFGKLPEKEGLLNFLKPIIEIRKEDEDIVREAMLEADETMYANGIVAVGDICNEPVSFAIKTESNIRYHNFVEVIGIDPEVAENRFKTGLDVYEQSVQIGLPCSIVPHAPYTVSPELLGLINNKSSEEGFPVCFHNQESEAELELFQRRTGEFVDFYKDMGLELDFFQPTLESSMAWMAANLRSTTKMMAVHNTYSTADDIKLANGYYPGMYWCFCPGANLYIEDATPDFSLFRDFDDRITIGTDGLASNTILSIFEELKIISQMDPPIDLATIIKWATLNGAEYLGIDNVFGSFEIGKKPGVNLIKNLDATGNQLTQGSVVEKLA